MSRERKNYTPEEEGNGDKSNFGRSVLPLVPTCKSEIGLIPLGRISPWDAREVAIVNCPRRARQTASNSIRARPRIAPSCVAASLFAPRPWNYWAPAKNPGARAVRKKPQKPVRGVRATPSPIET